MPLTMLSRFENNENNNNNNNTAKDIKDLFAVEGDCNPEEENEDEDIDDDDGIFFGLDDDIASFDYTNSTASVSSSSSSRTTTSSTQQQVPIVVDDIIPTLAPSSNPKALGVLEETCQNLVNDHDPSIKEDVLTDMFVHADQNDLDAILSKHLEHLSIEERMQGCKEVHGININPTNDNNDTTAAATDGNSRAKLPTTTATKIILETTANGGGEAAVITTTTTSPCYDVGTTRRGNTVSQFEEDKLQEFCHVLGVSSSPTNNNNNNGNSSSRNNKTSSSSQRYAFDLALSMDPKYVQDRKFLLLFLRSENNNIQAAVTRLYKHFEMKLELFGKEL